MSRRNSQRDAFQRDVVSKQYNRCFRNSPGLPLWYDRGGSIAIAICLAVVLGCNAEYDKNSKSVGAVNKVHSKYRTSFNLFKADRGQDEVNKATGVTLDCTEKDADGNDILTVDGNTVRSTCGVTFISPNHAVTAEHCIDSCKSNGDSLIIRQYDITGLSNDAIEDAAHILNTEANNPNEWVSRRILTEEDGYRHIDYDCHVVFSCVIRSGETRPHFCRIDGDDIYDDVALIECPGRWGDYVGVAESIEVDQPAETHWFHEIVDVMVPQDDVGKYCESQLEMSEQECLNMHTHYSMKASLIDCDRFAGERGAICQQTGGKSEHYHYLGFEDNRELQIIPVVTPAWARITAAKYVKASTWGCHGTSGSGLFVTNETGEKKLVGPSIGLAGLDSDLSDFLCYTENVTSDQDLLGYLNPEITRVVKDWGIGRDAAIVLSATNSVLL